MPTIIDIDPTIDPTKEILKEILKALGEGTLGFFQGSIEFSRVRSCCEWILEDKPEKVIFVRHLCGVLDKGDAPAKGLSRKLLAMVIKREPVAAPLGKGEQ